MSRFSSSPITKIKLDKKATLSIANPLEKYIKPLISAREFLNGQKRWCFWLVGVSPKELRASSEIIKRVQAVKEFRLNSERKATQKKAVIPFLFAEIRDFGNTYLVVPRVSSENRTYRD